MFAAVCSLQSATDMHSYKQLTLASGRNMCLELCVNLGEVSHTQDTSSEIHWHQPVSTQWSKEVVQGRVASQELLCLPVKQTSEIHWHQPVHTQWSTEVVQGRVVSQELLCLPVKQTCEIHWHQPILTKWFTEEGHQSGAIIYMIINTLSLWFRTKFTQRYSSEENWNLRKNLNILITKELYPTSFKVHSRWSLEWVRLPDLMIFVCVCVFFL